MSSTWDPWPRSLLSMLSPTYSDDEFATAPAPKTPLLQLVECIFYEPMGTAIYAIPHFNVEHDVFEIRTPRQDALLPAKS